MTCSKIDQQLLWVWSTTPTTLSTRLIAARVYYMLPLFTLSLLMVTEVTVCTELVPYNPPEIIKPFHEKTRKFALCGREWLLVQDWEKSGVAGVVWEAVSHPLTCTNRGGSAVFKFHCSFFFRLLYLETICKITLR